MDHAGKKLVKRQLDAPWKGLVPTLCATLLICASQVACDETMSEAIEKPSSTLAGNPVEVPYTHKGAIERKYAAPGPWAVAAATTTEICDREGNTCDLYYPAELGTNPLRGMNRGFRHPLIAWANGSGQLPERYDYFLRHLASWGFIIVASRDTGTGTGDTTVDATNYLLAQNQRADSLFFQMVDAHHVGTSGHSQGGGSVINLFADQVGLFSAFVAIHPSPHFFAIAVNGIQSPCQPEIGLIGGLVLPQTCLPLPSDFDDATKGAILYVNSVGDGGAGDTQLYYDETSNEATKSFGIVAEAGHDDIMGIPACRPDSPNCITGVYAYLGYPTAWLMWKLQDATDGPAAFHAQTGEFNQPTAAWNFNITNVQ